MCQRLTRPVKPFLKCPHPDQTSPFSSSGSFFLFSAPPLGTASRSFLRPATLRLLLVRFLLTNCLKHRRKFLASLPQSSRSLWEQYSLALECPITRAGTEEENAELISSVISARTRSTTWFERQTANTRFCRSRLCDSWKGADEGWHSKTLVASRRRLERSRQVRCGEAARPSVHRHRT